MSGSDADRIRFLTVRVGDGMYGVEVGHADGVIESPATTAVTNATDAVAGVARLHGEVTVVLNGHAVCGDDIEWTEAPQAVVLDRSGEGTPVALAVDTIKGMTDVHVTDITPAETSPFAARVETDSQTFPVFGVEALADLVAAAPVARGDED